MIDYADLYRTEHLAHSEAKAKIAQLEAAVANLQPKELRSIPGLAASALEAKERARELGTVPTVTVHADAVLALANRLSDLEELVERGASCLEMNSDKTARRGWARAIRVRNRISSRMARRGSRHGRMRDVVDPERRAVRGPIPVRPDRSARASL